MKSRHWCRDCKGTGKVRSTSVRLVHGVKKNYDFLVDCPGLLAEQFDTKRLELGGQDRAAGESEVKDD